MRKLVQSPSTTVDYHSNNTNARTLNNTATTSTINHMDNTISKFSSESNPLQSTAAKPRSVVVAVGFPILPKGQSHLPEKSTTSNPAQQRSIFNNNDIECKSLRTGCFIETVTFERFLTVIRRAYSQAAIDWAFLSPSGKIPLSLILGDSWRSVLVTCRAPFGVEPSIADRYCHRVLDQIEAPGPELCAGDRCVWLYPRLLQATSLQLRSWQLVQRVSKQ